VPKGWGGYKPYFNKNVNGSDFLLKPREENRIEKKKSLKTVLDTFFVPFYSTKNTRTDVFNNYNQRGNNRKNSV
jgi:hypothetical protein